MKSFSAVVALVLLAGPAQGQSANPSGQAIKDAFDQALRKADGKAFLSLVRPEESKGVTVKAATEFLKRFPQQWAKEPGMQTTGGARVRYDDPRNQMMIVFTPMGGTNYHVVNKVTRLFDTPVITSNGKRYAGATMAQILFGYAYHQATINKTPGLSKPQRAQQLFESYVPIVKKMGIHRSVEPETGKVYTWEQTIKESRAALAKLTRTATP
jgi:hypothetical protein